MDLIIYTDFLNPKQRYDSIINDFMQSKFVDSVKIIGMPITEPSLNIQIDTEAVRRNKISLDTLNKHIEDIVGNELKSLDELLNHFVINKSGHKIPLRTLAKAYHKAEYYKPKIFLPKPDSFHYQNTRAIKMELYTSKKDKKDLIELIMTVIPDNSNNFNTEQWKFEIIE
ncbi:MAG: hypothetical protein RIM83_12465 [Allomuricauda sp.]|jgi:hypothetical protein|uniref:hypothetical protein n=1 Tax=Allomuricauda sp. CP2A TaxID=1848189 RepID=UPI00082B5F01|nr:hypothetical protein [Muricauda sp. CP2A]